MATDIYLLAGLLGSGKTSALAHSLRRLPQPERTVALVNEAGAAGLDGKLAERAGVPVKELSNGCICCSLAVNLAALLDELLGSPAPPACVLLEASGLANPAKLLKVFERFKARLGVCKTIVLMDATLWEAREVMGDFWLSQLAAADLIVLNKTDLLGPGEEESILQELAARFPLTAITPATFGQVDPDLFFAPAPRKADGLWSLWALDQQPGMSVFSFKGQRPVDLEAFQAFMAGPGAAFERVKGQLWLGDKSVYFDYVRGRADWSEPLAGLSGSQLVVIGRDIDENLLKPLRELGLEPLD